MGCVRVWVTYRLNPANVLPREASSNLKRSHRHSATHTAMPTTPLHHKSLFKSLSLLFTWQFYLISCLPSRMAYIQQEKAFRFNRIRIFRTNITKASTQSRNLFVEMLRHSWVIWGHVETLIWSKEFLQVRRSRPVLPILTIYL